MAFTPNPTLAENARALIDQLSRYASAGPLPLGQEGRPGGPGLRAGPVRKRDALAEMAAGGRQLDPGQGRCDAAEGEARRVRAGAAGSAGKTGEEICFPIDISAGFPARNRYYRHCLPAR